MLYLVLDCIHRCTRHRLYSKCTAFELYNICSTCEHCLRCNSKSWLLANHFLKSCSLFKGWAKRWKKYETKRIYCQFTKFFFKIYYYWQLISLIFERMSRITRLLTQQLYWTLVVYEVILFFFLLTFNVFFSQGHSDLFNPFHELESRLM